MNKASIEARLAALQADREKNLQQITVLQQGLAQRSALDHTLNGAIQEATYWSAQIPAEPADNLREMPPAEAAAG